MKKLTGQEMQISRLNQRCDLHSRQALDLRHDLYHFKNEIKSNANIHIIIWQYILSTVILVGSVYVISHLRWV